MIKKYFFSLITICYFSANLIGQSDSCLFNIQTLGGNSTNSTTPFWLRSNQNGNVPLVGPSFSMVGAIRKSTRQTQNMRFDWGGALEGRLNLGREREIILIESYIKARLWIFQFKAGRSGGMMGLVDTTLSSGALAISGNSRGIPSLELAIPEFWIPPILGEFFAFKGNYVHGWMGENVLKKSGREGDTVMTQTYFHQKSFYTRFGRPDSKLKVYAGFNHQVTWVNGNSYYESDFSMPLSQMYYYVVTGKRYNNGDIMGERLGNHLGSLDLGVEYFSGKVRMFVYRQQIYETGALAYLANIQDGLSGIALTNLKNQDRVASWDKILLEFLYTKIQGGPPWAPSSPSGAESYYNHGQFLQGWAYNGTVMGSPFITSRVYAREELPDNPSQYFINNRLYALHFGFHGEILGFDCTLRSSWSRNTGTYWTSEEALDAGIPEVSEYGVFYPKDQFSSYVSMNRGIKKGLSAGIIGAFDYGDLLENSYGLYLRLSYTVGL